MQAARRVLQGVDPDTLTIKAVLLEVHFLPARTYLRSLQGYAHGYGSELPARSVCCDFLLA
jgi:hypothetical protein